MQPFNKLVYIQIYCITYLKPECLTLYFLVQIGQNSAK